METRELYRQKYEAQIAEWSAKLAVLKARGEKATAQARLAAQPHLDDAHTHLEAVQGRLAALTEATDARWDEARAGAEHTWDRLKGAVEGAYDAHRGTGKDADPDVPPPDAS